MASCLVEPETNARQAMWQSFLTGVRKRKLLLAHLAHYKDNQSKVKSKCDSAVLGLKKFIPSKLTALSISQNWPAGPWPDPAFWQWNRRFPRGFAEKPSPLSIMCRIRLLWMVNVDSKWNSHYDGNGLASQFWQMESALSFSSSLSLLELLRHHCYLPENFRCNLKFFEGNNFSDSYFYQIFESGIFFFLLWKKAKLGRWKVKNSISEKSYMNGTVI